MPQFRFPGGLSIRIDHYFPGQEGGEGTNAKLDAILRTQQQQQTTLNTLLQQGGQLMATVQQLRSELEGINTATNQLAEVQTAQAATITEIGSDIADLLARVPDLPEDVLTQANALREKLAAAAATASEQAATLTSIASQHTPATQPPPVEEPPPPVEEPPPAPVEG